MRTIVYTTWACHSLGTRLLNFVWDTVKQKMFYAVRNSRSRTLIEEMNVELYHVASELCDSDCATKFSKQNMSTRESYWKSFFFFQAVSSWPCRRYEYNTEHVPVETLNPKMMVVTALKTQIKQNILENIIRRFSS